MGSQGDAMEGGRWALYDEKYITLPALTQHKYDTKKPLDWLQFLRDYVSGRRQSSTISLIGWSSRPSRSQSRC